MIWYDGRLFRLLDTTGDGDVCADTVFRYSQKDDIVTARYSGGAVELGQLIGLVDEAGLIDMRYHHINVDGDIMTGICRSRPEVQANGKLRLYETWRWTNGDRSKGTSILEEM